MTSIPNFRSRSISLLIVVVVLHISPQNAFLIPSFSTTFTTTHTQSTSILTYSFIKQNSRLYAEGEDDVEEAKKIPKKYRAEIYKAESQTPAAQGRQNRVIAYGSLAFLFLILGVSNVILTTMKRAGGVDLDDIGYGWTISIPLLSNTWGGYIDIIAAGLFGTMVELENRTRDEVALQIWKEFEKRKNKEDEKEIQKVARLEKRKGKKKKKRLAALAEVILEDDDEEEEVETKAVVEEKSITEEMTPKKAKKKKGVFDKMKNFYNQADQMAASQALLLNKKLEEQGIVEKITDETGLKIVGKEKAATSQFTKKEENTEESK